jgi:hypothetical protein
MTHLEDNDVFHAKILLDKVHAPRPIDVLKGVFIVAVQSVHDVPLKVFQQIHLILEILREFRDRVILPYIDLSVSSGRDKVKVALQKGQSAARVVKLTLTVCLQRESTSCCR